MSKFFTSRVLLSFLKQKSKTVTIYLASLVSLGCSDTTGAPNPHPHPVTPATGGHKWGACHQCDGWGHVTNVTKHSQKNSMWRDIGRRSVAGDKSRDAAQQQSSRGTECSERCCCVGRGEVRRRGRLRKFQETRAGGGDGQGQASSISSVFWKRAEERDAKGSLADRKKKNKLVIKTHWFDDTDQYH